MANLDSFKITVENGFIVEQHFLGFQARKFFLNGYGISIIPEVGASLNLKGLTGQDRNKILGEEKYEIAVLSHQGNGKNCQLCYDNPITDDVLRYLTLPDVIKVMEQIEALPERNSVKGVTLYTEEMAAEDELLLSGVSPDEEWRLK